MDYDYFYEQYRRVPRNSATIHRDVPDYQSTATASSYNAWSGYVKRPVTTTYIDGSTLFGHHERPYSVKGLFPKGKGRQKPSIPPEKKINTGDTFMSLVPAERPIADSATVRSERPMGDSATVRSERPMGDTATVRSERTRSPLSMGTASQSLFFPDVQRKSADIRNNRIYSATILDNENSEAKIYGRCATTHANGAWVRRYKSITESQTLTDLLLDQANRDKILLKKRTCQQLILLSSSSKSSFTSSLIRRRRAQC